MGARASAIDRVCDGCQQCESGERHVNPYVPILVLGALAGGFAVFSSSPARSPVPSATTGPSSTPTSAASSRRRSRSGGGRFPVKYYLTAMLFIIFDIEIIFLYPWAVTFDALGALRAGRDGAVHRHRVRRLRLRVAARRAGVGLRQRLIRTMGIEEKLPSGFLLTTRREARRLRRARARCGRRRSAWPAAPSR